MFCCNDITYAIEFDVRRPADAKEVQNSLIESIKPSHSIQEDTQLKDKISSSECDQPATMSHPTFNPLSYYNTKHYTEDCEDREDINSDDDQELTCFNTAYKFGLRNQPVDFGDTA